MPLRRSKNSRRLNHGRLSWLFHPTSLLGWRPIPITLDRDQGLWRLNSLRLVSNQNIHGLQCTSVSHDRNSTGGSGWSVDLHVAILLFVRSAHAPARWQNWLGKITLIWRNYAVRKVQRDPILRCQTNTLNRSYRGLSPQSLLCMGLEPTYPSQIFGWQPHLWVWRLSSNSCTEACLASSSVNLVMISPLICIIFASFWLMTKWGP